MPDPKDSSQLDRLEVLETINRLLDAVENEHSTFVSVLELVTKVTHASRGVLLLVQDEEAVTEVAVCQQFDDDTKGESISAAGRELLDQVLQMGESRITEGMTTSRSAEDKQPANNQQGMLLAVPLRTRGQILGAVYLESYEDRAFLPQDVSFTELAATLIAMAIDHSSLKAAIQDAKQEKYRYVSLVTHELRVPLTSISGYTDMLVTGMVGELSERQEFFLQTIKRNVGRMGKLITSLSEINRIESGRMKIELNDFDIAILLEEIAAEFQETLSERDQQLSVQVALELLPVHADRALIGQVLTNLINNASQYSSEGSVMEVKVNESGAFAQVEVIDNGIGISKADQSQLFTPFFRSEDENVRQHVGWGLDLAVAQKFIQAQGGEISCQSELGAGSNFVFTLPLSAIAQNTMA